MTGRKKQGRVQLLHQGQTGRRRKYCQGLPQLIGLARVEAVRGKVYGILNSIHNAVLGLPAPTVKEREPGIRPVGRRQLNPWNRIHPGPRENAPRRPRIDLLKEMVDLRNKVHIGAGDERSELQVSRNELCSKRQNEQR